VKLKSFQIEVHSDPGVMGSPFPFSAMDFPLSDLSKGPDFSPFFIFSRNKIMAEILRSKGQRKARRKKMEQKFEKCPKPQSATLLALGVRTIARSVFYTCLGKYNQYRRFRYVELTPNAASHKKR